MTRHADSARLQHMLDHAREARDLADGKTRADLDSDRLFNLAMTRLLEIVGEAAARVSKPMQDRHSTIPWPQIVGFRNRVIHGYDSVDFDVLWYIIERDLPPLITELEGILAPDGVSDPDNSEDP